MIKRLITKQIKNTKMFKVLEEENKDLRSQINTKKTENKNLTNRAKNLQTQIQYLETNNQNLTQQNQDLETINQNFTQQNQDLETINQNFTELIQILETNNQDLTQENQILETNNQKLETNNQNLTQQNQILETINQNFTQQNQNSDTIILYLTQQNQDLETINQNFTELIQILETNNQNLTQENQILETNNQKLETNNQNLTDKIQILETNNQNLTDKIQILETNNQNLTQENQILETNNQNLTQENQILETNNQKLETNNQNLTDKIQILETNNQNFTQQNQTLETNNQTFKIQINNLQKVKETLLDDRKELVESTLKMDKKELRTDTVKPSLLRYIQKAIKEYEHNNELFTLWISDNLELPELQQLSLKSMVLTGHKVTLYTYNELKYVPDGIKVVDANKIIDESNIFTYKEGFNKGSYAGFADLFRVKCLYERGTSWFDCDILAVKNINNIHYNGPTIASEYTRDGRIHPNNGFLRLEKGDKLLKGLLDDMKVVDVDNMKHGETGPKLLKLKMDRIYKEYYDYLVNPSFIASINYFDYKDFLKLSKDIVPKLKFNEIWGFHMWNAMFREFGNEHETISIGFYNDLREAISTSSLQKEYEQKIQNIFKNP